MVIWKILSKNIFYITKMELCICKNKRKYYNNFQRTNIYMSHSFAQHINKIVMILQYLDEFKNKM